MAKQSIQHFSMGKFVLFRKLFSVAGHFHCAFLAMFSVFVNIVN